MEVFEGQILSAPFVDFLKPSLIVADCVVFEGLILDVEGLTLIGRACGLLVAFEGLSLIMSCASDVLHFVTMGLSLIGRLGQVLVAFGG